MPCSCEAESLSKLSNDAILNTRIGDTVQTTVRHRITKLLGHKNIKNTLVYTHLVDFGSDEFVCKVARNVDDAKQLVESGFDYVTDVDGMKLFRKRR